MLAPMLKVEEHKQKGEWEKYFFPEEICTF